MGQTRTTVIPEVRLGTDDGKPVVIIEFPETYQRLLNTPQEAVDLARAVLAKAKEAGLDLGDDSSPPWTKERMLALVAGLESIIYTFLSGNCKTPGAPVEQLKNVQPIQHRNPVGLLMHMQHCLWMLTQMPKFVEQNRLYKFNRWLSDIGGVLRTLGIVTLDDLRILFAPEGAEINHERK